jgi:ABC-type transport system substrate-binding protein
VPVGWPISPSGNNQQVWLKLPLLRRLSARGINADDASGEITITLSKPYGAPPNHVDLNVKTTQTEAEQVREAVNYAIDREIVLTLPAS